MIPIFRINAKRGKETYRILHIKLMESAESKVRVFAPKAFGIYFRIRQITSAVAGNGQLPSGFCSFFQKRHLRPVLGCCDGRHQARSTGTDHQYVHFFSSFTASFGFHLCFPIPIPYKCYPICRNQHSADNAISSFVFNFSYNFTTPASLHFCRDMRIPSFACCQVRPPWK